MRVGLILFLAGLSACAPGLSGQLVSSDGLLSMPKDAKVNVTRLDVSSGSEVAAASVFIGDVASDGTFAVTLQAGEGEYLVEAVVPGYAVASQKINLNEGNTVNMQIEPVGQPKASTFSTNMGAESAVGAGGATLTPPKL